MLHLHSAQGSNLNPSMILAVKGSRFLTAMEPRTRLDVCSSCCILSSDSSHQSLPLALRDDELEWRAYLSRLGFNEVSAPPPLIGNYLVHQEFWQLSKSQHQGTYLVGNLEFFLRWNWKLHHTFLLNQWYDKGIKLCWLDLSLFILEE